MPKRKNNREFKAPLVDVDNHSDPFQVPSIGVMGPYHLTPRRIRYILTYIDNLSQYTEAFVMPDQSAKTVAMIYATQILTRHGTGSKLISDQGPAFMSALFNETCKILGISRARTTPYHPSSNGMVERFQRSLHVGMSHYINAANRNWIEVLPFYLMAYRTTPNTTTGYSLFFLLHCREMSLQSNENLKAKLSKPDPILSQRMDNLKATLKRAYKAVGIANKRSHQTNKEYYDRRAKPRSFEVGEYVYVFNPARKSGL